MSFKRKSYSAFIILSQISILVLIWGMSELFHNFFRLRVSGGIIGVFFILILLISGLLKKRWIQKGNDYLLAELMLLFIPCVVGLTNYKELLVTHGAYLLISILMSTICIIIATNYFVNLGLKLEKYLNSKRQEVKKS